MSESDPVMQKGLTFIAVCGLALFVSGVVSLVAEYHRDVKCQESCGIDTVLHCDSERAVCATPDPSYASIRKVGK